MKKNTQQDASKPLLLTFTQGHASRLDRVMLKKMADHFGWTETQTIHVSLMRMFVTTFPQYVDDGPLPKRNLTKSSESTNLHSSDFVTLSNWVTSAKAGLLTKTKSKK